MKKLLFILVFIPCVSFAEGPIFHHPETEKQQEFENVYKDLRTKVSSPSGKTIVTSSGTDCNSLAIQIGATTGTGIGNGGTNSIRLFTSCNEMFSVDSSNINLTTNTVVAGTMTFTGKIRGTTGVGSRLIQTVVTTVTSSTQTTSTSFVDSSLTCTLPGIVSGNTVQVWAYGMVDNTTATQNTYWTINRGSSNLGSATDGFGRATSGSGGLRAAWNVGPYYDTTPGSGSTTYTVRIRVDGGTGGLCLSGNCQMVCQEWGAVIN